MTKFLPIGIFLLFINLACMHKGQSVAKSKNTSCIQSKIELFSKQSCQKGANIKEFKFMQKQVFVLDPGNCGADMTTEVLDSECRNLGYLGGISGNMKINGTNFDEAEFIKTIWER